MAYDGTIPALGNLISNDIPAMQENFSLLESAQVVDEGSTADGDYIRYENGWQLMTSVNDLPASAESDWSDRNGFYSFALSESIYDNFSVPNSYTDILYSDAIIVDSSTSIFWYATSFKNPFSNTTYIGSPSTHGYNQGEWKIIFYVLTRWK